VAHEPFYFGAWRSLTRVNERGSTIDIVAPQGVDDGFDWLQGAFVKDEITRKDMNCENTTFIQEENSEERNMYDGGQS
jgi:hypothetical protein